MVFKNPLKILVQFSTILCTFFSYVYVIMANLKFYMEVHAYFSILACSVIQLDNSLNRLLQVAMYLNTFKTVFRVRNLGCHAFMWISHSSPKMSLDCSNIKSY